ncbi:DsbA family protein [Amycolatopsis suaedae]|uniref:Disulfide bond formation protein DsbA n=1 Tax=Amycolatopsis suaedae TaxID=2510978 RepID=A0A4V2ELQ4_9PSEU|nr:thioredoxin domain-containing protein [Amycolatopsis suaedae]RZQ62375.1 disulfide bond formation protein DsbA [Amycolatopsis suaedae]
MTANTKISLTVLGVVAVVVTALILFTRSDPPAQQQPAPQAAPASVLVRPNSHRLSTSDGKVTVVEFLDFECESCRAAYPAVEKLRADYAGKVTFVLRYFPVPSHVNAELAARAVEAASQQGKLEPMYKRMFETQQQWGNQQVEHRETFLGFARDLGLDMTAFQAALDSPATAERVLADRADGVDAGVRGTPTFFVNGVKFTGGGYDALKAAIDAELAK